MAAPVISVRNISKRYHLGDGLAQDTLRDHIVDALGSVKKVFARNGEKKQKGEVFWALKDVSFDVQPGEVIGVVGRNGAGKSTLLKLLSQISEPSSGEIAIRGRLASLLEVGTGFHPELTGRENIFLNGAILGMRKSEITKKFDEIVAFAEVEKFLDTPVKRYSSGMYVRLAFAVAAHLEPDILVVDEVLAVGDMQFQKKCLGKMQEVANNQGRTVLFVTHNMGTIVQLCTRCILLQKGQLTEQGRPTEVVKAYLGQQLSGCPEWNRPDDLKEISAFVFRRVSLSNKQGHKSALFDGNEPITITLDYDIATPMGACQIAVLVLNAEGVVVFASCDGDPQYCAAQPREAGKFKTTVTIPGHMLPPGMYNISAHCHFPKRSWFDRADMAVAFEVTPSGSLVALEGRRGFVAPLLDWTTKKV